MTAVRELDRDALRADLSMDIVDFLVRLDEERVALYRRLIACTVTRTSSLLLGFARAEGIDIADFLGMIMPPPDWPSAQASVPRRRSNEVLLRDDHKGFMFGGARRDRAFHRRMGTGGIVVRPPSDPRGRFGLRVAGTAVEACFDLGPLRLVVGAGTARMRLPPAMPETLLTSCVGRTIDRLVGHPLFDGRDMVIGRVDFAASPSGCAVVTFRDEVAAIDLRGRIGEVG